MNAELTLFPNPVKAWIWRGDCSQVTGFRSMGQNVTPRVSDDGHTSYYLNGEYVQFGYVIVDDDGKFKVYPPEEARNRFTL